MSKAFKIVLMVCAIVLVLAVSGCTQYVPIVETVIETVVVTETIVETVIETVEDTEKIAELEEEISDYKELILNLDELRKCVYYVYGDNGSTWVEGTGFSLLYEGKTYLVTAGHIIDGEWGIHKNLGFRDYRGNWIYPKLLRHDNQSGIGKDYAIFEATMENYLQADNNNDTGRFRITTEKIVDCRNQSIPGESGSPIIDNDGEVVGIVNITSFLYITKIQDIFEGD